MAAAAQQRAIRSESGWLPWRREIIRASENHQAVDVRSLLNVFLDALPRIEIRWSGKPQPAFRTWGTIGFAVGALVAVAGAFLGGRSMLALAEATGVAVLSFFGWALLRRAIAGVEKLVLLEHVWIALLSVAIALRLQGLPIAATLDPFCAGLAFFLAGGRAGCTLVGCCHGHPSTIGIRYPAGHAKGGFAAHLTGIRLFPVQLLEFSGLVAIGITTFLAIPFAQPGHPTLWYLFSYALLRFALEELRGDERPHLFAMSIPRWMCLVELAFTLSLMQPAHWIPILIVISALALYLGRDRDQRLLATKHIRELQELLVKTRKLGLVSEDPTVWVTSLGATLAISKAATPAQPTSSRTECALHLSLCLPSRKENLELACRLAAEAFPRLDTAHAIYSGKNTLHFTIPPTSGRDIHDRTFMQLYRSLLLKSQDASGTTAMAQPASSSNQPIPWHWRGNGRDAY